MVGGSYDAISHVAGAFDIICAIRVLEIDPWPPSRAMESSGSPVFLEWISNNQENSAAAGAVLAYGISPYFTAIQASDGKLVFRDSPYFYATLYLNVSSHNRSGDESNCVGFNLYEQQGGFTKRLGTATINLTDYPQLQTLHYSVNTSIPVSCETSTARRLNSFFRGENGVRPQLYLNIMSQTYA